MITVWWWCNHGWPCCCFLLSWQLKPVSRTRPSFSLKFSRLELLTGVISSCSCSCCCSIVFNGYQIDRRTWAAVRTQEGSLFLLFFFKYFIIIIVKQIYIKYFFCFSSNKNKRPENHHSKGHHHNNKNYYFSCFALTLGRLEKPIRYVRPSGVFMSQPNGTVRNVRVTCTIPLHK